MKTFEISPTDLGIEKIVSPTNLQDLEGNEDVVAIFMEGELIGNTDGWDFKGFLDSVPTLKTSGFRDEALAKRYIEEFRNSDEGSFYEFACSKGYDDNLLEDYILTFGDNAFKIEREGGRAYANSMYDIDITYYLIDDDNVSDNISQEDFQEIQRDNQ